MGAAVLIFFSSGTIVTRREASEGKDGVEGGKEVDHALPPRRGTGTVHHPQVCTVPQVPPPPPPHDHLPSAKQSPRKFRPLVLGLNQEFVFSHELNTVVPYHPFVKNITTVNHR